MTARGSGKKLTKAQLHALNEAATKGSPFANVGVRQCAGGSYRRMVERLAEQGLLSKPPYKITKAGRAALKEKAQTTQQQNRGEK
jgi:hypothetical protein